MDLGNKILKLRKNSNLSQEQLAEKMGVSRQTISKWEFGETAPDIKQAQKLSKLFNISLDELVGNIEAGGDSYLDNITNAEKYSDGYKVIDIIDAYVKNNGGSCKVKEVKRK